MEFDDKIPSKIEEQLGAEKQFSLMLKRRQKQLIRF